MVVLGSKIAFESRAEWVTAKQQHHVVDLQSYALLAKNLIQKSSTISKIGQSPWGISSMQFFLPLLGALSIYKNSIPLFFEKAQYHTMADWKQ